MRILHYKPQINAFQSQYNGYRVNVLSQSNHKRFNNRLTGGTVFYYLTA